MVGLFISTAKSYNEISKQFFLRFSRIVTLYPFFSFMISISLIFLSWKLDFSLEQSFVPLKGDQLSPCHL